MKNQLNSPINNIYNMDGAGVGGNPTDGYAAYGATKRAMPQLTSSICKVNFYLRIIKNLCG